MKVSRVCFSALLSAALVTCACLHIGSAHGAAPIVIGPGPNSLLYVTSPDDYHVLDGTQITSPSRTSPPDFSAVVTDAIEFRGGGHIQIDGGYFRGGDATYTGPNGNIATASAGDALHLRHSTGTVYGGTFIGGDASATTGLYNASGGDSIILVDSELTVYDGYFEAGVGTSPGPTGEMTAIQSSGAFLADNSFLYLHGGHFYGSIRLGSGSTLTVFARNYQIDGMAVSGEYADGSVFTHQIVNNGGTIILRGVPEPTAACLAVMAGCIAFGFCRRHTSR